MAKITAMTRSKGKIKELEEALGPSFSCFTLSGCDESSSVYNPKGYKKKVDSDFIRIYRNKNSNSSFAFAFNNYYLPNCGVIVSVKVDEKVVNSIFLTYDEFKPLLGKLIKSIPDNKNMESVLDIIKSVFTSSNVNLCLNEFYRSLVVKVNELEEEYDRLTKMDSKKNKLKINMLIKQYSNFIDEEVDSLVKEKPYLSTRMIGSMLRDKISLHKANNGLNWILRDKLNIRDRVLFRPTL